MQNSQSDLTVIYITANETPKHWAKYHLDVLFYATAHLPIISVSRKPMDLGINLIDDQPKSYVNIYRQLLRAAWEVKTPYLAVAEDDTLYCKEHFDFFRPKMDEVAYNMSKWSLFTWDPTYNLKMRKTNAALIAPTQYFITCLEERFNKFNGNPPEELAGEIGRHQLERGMGITLRNAVEVYSQVPIIQVSHPNGTEGIQRTKRKKLGAIKATCIPFWGEAQGIIERYE